MEDDFILHHDNDRRLGAVELVYCVYEDEAAYARIWVDLAQVECSGGEELRNVLGLERRLSSTRTI